MSYTLEKWFWTDEDYHVMGWHDCSLYKWKLEGQVLSLDIDYIFEWVNPPEQGLPFRFWLSPATLVFEGVNEPIIDLTTREYLGIQIADLHQIMDNGRYQWCIETDVGSFKFHAEGYRQYIRSAPSLQFGQYVPDDERGALSLSETTGEGLESHSSGSTIARKARESELYKLVIDRMHLLAGLKEIQHNIDNRIGDLKSNLLQKQNADGTLKKIAKELKDTFFDSYGVS